MNSILISANDIVIVYDTWPLIVARGRASAEGAVQLVPSERRQCRRHRSPSAQTRLNGRSPIPRTHPIDPMQPQRFLEICHSTFVFTGASRLFSVVSGGVMDCTNPKRMAGFVKLTNPVRQLTHRRRKRCAETTHVSILLFCILGLDTGARRLSAKVDQPDCRL